jgi:hypothetical protein
MALRTGLAAGVPLSKERADQQYDRVVQTGRYDGTVKLV